MAVLTKQDEFLSIEVAYALPAKQKIIPLKVKLGTSVQTAALQAGMQLHFPDLDVSQARLGIFGKLVPKPAEQLVKEGDRIEIYRPLVADPKEARVKRAAKSNSA